MIVETLVILGLCFIINVPVGFFNIENTDFAIIALSGLLFLKVGSKILSEKN